MNAVVSDSMQAVESAIRKVARLDEYQDIESLSVFDLGIDSLTIVDLIMEIESRLGIQIPLEELSEDVFVSLEALTNFVDRFRA